MEKHYHENTAVSISFISLEQEISQLFVFCSASMHFSLFSSVSLRKKEPHLYAAPSNYTSLPRLGMILNRECDVGHFKFHFVITICNMPTFIFFIC